MDKKLSKKILIVEDDVSLLKALQDKLSQEGYEVYKAWDGKIGLALALEKKPDLILLDIVMPVMDGMTMLKKLRNEGSYGKEVPVILLTNLNPDSERVNRGVTINEPAFYLIKSNWTLDEVMQKIKECL